MALTDSIQGYWNMDESSGTRADSTSNNNDLTDNNTVASATGIISNGADFEVANSESLSITNASQTGLNITGDLSVSLWVKFETAVIADFLNKGYEGNTTRQYDFYWEPNLLVFQTCSDGVGGAGGAVAWTPSTATWYHLVAVYDSTTPDVTFYVNGSQQGAAQTTVETPIFNGTGIFTIGSQSGVFTDGIIDEVGIWSRQLTTDEITQLYNSGAGLTYPFGAGATTVFPHPTLLTLGVG